MGSVTRHANIFRNNFPKIKRIREEDFIYLHIGNFLTDFSQFRDPFAHLSAKRRIKEEAVAAKAYGVAPLLGLAHYDKWSDEVFGSKKDNSKRVGKLADFFKYISLAIVHLVYSDDILKKEKIRELLDLFPDGLQFVPSLEIDRIFNENFTQYYPHEHLDMPPWNEKKTEKQKTSEHDYYTTIAYLAKQKQYLAEELTKLQGSWKSKKDLSHHDPARHDMLIQLGHLLHPVEDYFFHSNYVEIHLWRTRRGKYSSQMTPEEFTKQFALNPFKEYVSYKGYEEYKNMSPETRARWTRKLLRRLRFPLYAPYQKVIGIPGLAQPVAFTITELLPSRTLSDPSFDLIYTGGFEANDMFYTIINALESISDLFIKVFANYETSIREAKKKVEIPGNPDLVNPLYSELTLLNVIFKTDVRKKLLNEKYKDEAIKKHSNELKSNIYHKKIDALQEEGWLNKQAADALQKAFEIDLDISTRYPKIFGPGGLLISIIAVAQKQIDDSNQISENLDKQDTRRNTTSFTDDFPSDNGAIAEIIGTHSLLSKDTPKSQPLYEDANSLAKYASLSIASIMLKEINNAGLAKEVDWTKILQNYLRFPLANATMWETLALNYYRMKGNDPGIGDIKDIHDLIDSKFRIDKSQLNAIRTGKTKEDLEAAYKSLEKNIKL